MYRDDYLTRLFRQLMEAAGRALGLRATHPEEALQAIEDAKRGLPLVPGALESMSMATVVELLGGAEPALGLAHLYRAEAEVRAQLQDEAAATRCARRALRILTTARLGNDLTPQDRDAFRTLAGTFLPAAELLDELRATLQSARG
jgi:hypothetical protein